MSSIHELNAKLRTIDTGAKKLKSEYEAVAKRRGRELLTEYSNAYLRMENTNDNIAATTSSTSIFPTEAENKAFSRAAARKRETAVLARRAKLERDLKPKLKRVREKFLALLEELETTVPSSLPKEACFSENFVRLQADLLERHVAELDFKLSALENVLRKTSLDGDDENGGGGIRRSSDESSSSSRNVLLVAIAAWFLEPKLP
jgi:hypothetical protein